MLIPERALSIFHLLQHAVGVAARGGRGILRSTSAGWVLVALIPAVFTASLVEDYAVDVPMWDDWERAPLLEKVIGGTAGFSDFYAAHIQHRMVVPRAIMVVINHFWNGDLRAEMASTVVFATLAAVFASLLVRHSLGHNWASLGIAFLISCILLHPLQYQNLLWAVQNALLLPSAVTLAGLWVVLATGWSLRTRWLIALICALVSTHSFSHGLISWPVLLAALLLREDAASLRARLL